MSSRKAFRLAPARDGIMAASVWRFWWQGNEFYGAPRNALQYNKDSKLVVGLVVSSGKTKREPPIPREGGEYIWSHALRDGRRLVLHSCRVLLTEEDRAHATRQTVEAPTFQPVKGPKYAELTSFTSQPETGSVVIITPLSERVFEGTAL